MNTSCKLSLFGMAFTGCLLAQSTTGGTQPTKPQQTPQLSGRQNQQSGSVAVQQTTAAGSSSTVNTSTTTIQVQGNYSGSVPGSEPGGAMTLERAIHMALRYNLGPASASASLRQARGQRLSALSQLLPNISASVSENAAKTNLEAEGLSTATLGGAIPLPVTVGPYHYYDVRATLNFDVLDFTALHNLRESRASEQAAQLSEKDARELVAVAVSGEYLKILADAAMVEAQQAQVSYAGESYKQAEAQLAAGTKAPVDAQRSLVQLQTEQQRLTSQKADLIKEKRTLARIIGLPLDVQFDPQEELVDTPGAAIALDEALKKAYAQRADLKSAAAQLRAAEESVKAARSERLPSASVSGYMGLQGVNPNQGNGVFSATASLSVPIWQGGRIHADEEQARASVDQRRAEYLDQRGVVELDVRNAYTDFETANTQVIVARSNRTLALQTLQQSQDRFIAGVATSVEVVQSQESQASADRDYISSLYSQNVAKITLARAMGEAENSIPQLLKGK